MVNNSNQSGRALSGLGLQPWRGNRTVFGSVLLKPLILIRALTTGGYKLGFEPGKAEGQNKQILQGGILLFIMHISSLTELDQLQSSAPSCRRYWDSHCRSEGICPF